MSDAVQSAATYGVQGMIPWYSYTALGQRESEEAQAAGWGMTDPRYMDTAGTGRTETTAKLGANQYYLYPYGAMYHKGFLYSQLQATEYTGKPLDEGTQWYYFHARHYDSAYGRFIGHDLVAPDLSNPLTLNPFLYCLNNPGRWVDPDGRWVESGWDAFSLGVGIYSFKGNIKAGNYLAAGIDAVGIAFDSGALIAPVIPGGAGASIKALRAADQVAALPAQNYDGVRALSSMLKHSGVARKDRLGVINSFVEGTIHVRTAGASQFGLRYFDNVNAFEKGRYLFETFPASRKGLSLDPVWNQMSGLKQFQIREGATFFEGLAAPQTGLFNNLDFLSGGQTQFYVPNLGDLH